MTITNKEDALRAVQADGMSLADCSPDLQADRDVVLAAVSQYGSALAYASAVLKNDREVVLAAVRKHGTVLYYASSELKNDRGVMLAAVSQNGFELLYASEGLRNDREVVLAAVRTNGGVLEHVSAEFKYDREVVLAAVSQLEINPECIKCIQKPRRQQLYDLISPLSIVSFHCGEAAQDKLTGVITGLMTLSYHSPLRALVGSNDRPHSSSNLNWIHDVSLKILGYLSVKDIVRLMQTPANVYVKASDGSERPCQAIETHQGYLGLFSWLFRKSEPRYQRTSEDEANKQRYLTLEDFKVLR